MARRASGDDPCAMTNLAAGSWVVRPPADRPAGKRGLRGPLAAAVAIAAFYPYALSQFGEEPPWGKPVWLAAAAALLAAAVLIWTARRAAALAVAAALVLLGVGAAVATERSGHDRTQEAEKWGGSSWTQDARGPRLTRAEADAVPEGLTRAQLTSRVGVPAGRGIQHVRGAPDLRCLVYRGRKGPRVPVVYAFCFEDGRYTELREW